MEHMRQEVQEFSNISEKLLSCDVKFEDLTEKERDVIEHYLSVIREKLRNY